MKLTSKPDEESTECQIYEKRDPHTISKSDFDSEVKSGPQTITPEKEDVQAKEDEIAKAYLSNLNNQLSLKTFPQNRMNLKISVWRILNFRYLQINPYLRVPLLKTTNSMKKNTLKRLKLKNLNQAW